MRFFSIVKSNGSFEFKSTIQFRSYWVLLFFWSASKKMFFKWKLPFLSIFLPKQTFPFLKMKYFRKIVYLRHSYYNSKSNCKNSTWSFSAAVKMQNGRSFKKIKKSVHSPFVRSKKHIFWRKKQKTLPFGSGESGNHLILRARLMQWQPTYINGLSIIVANADSHL